MNKYDYLMKCILVGDSGVGKSCLLYQFLAHEFRKEIEPTIGMEFGAKILELNDLIVRLQIWDSAGQENYRSITRSYYRNTICGFLVYDITSRKSFENIKQWLDETRTYGSADLYLVLVGNKCELTNREVEYKEGKAFAEDNKMHFFETSAKENINVQEMFIEIVKIIL